MRQHAQRDQAEAEGQCHLHGPSGNRIDQRSAGAAFGKHELHAGDGQQHSNNGGNGSRDQVSRGAKSKRQSRFMHRKKSEQPAVAGRDRASDHPHQEAKVLHDGRLAHDAGVQQLAQQSFEQGQNHHGKEHQGQGEIFRRTEPAPPGGHLAPGKTEGALLSHHGGHLPPPVWRYCARSCCTRSNMTAGTIPPRTVGYTLSAFLRHSASSAAVATCTCMPRFLMASTACSLSQRLRLWILLPASSAALRSDSWAEAGSFSHVSRLITSAPTRGTQFTSSMCLVTRLNCPASATIGEVGTASTIPVCKAGMRLVHSSCTGWQFAAFMISTWWSPPGPAVTNIFIFLQRSSG